VHVFAQLSEGAFVCTVSLGHAILAPFFPPTVCIGMISFTTSDTWADYAFLCTVSMEFAELAVFIVVAVSTQEARL
jgi:hypothetical protein